MAEVIETGLISAGMNRKWTASIRMFNARLGVHEVLDAADVARAKFSRGGKTTFLYFCGVCWNLIRKLEGV